MTHISNGETLFKHAYTCQVYYYLLLTVKFIVIEVVEVLIKVVIIKTSEINKVSHRTTRLKHFCNLNS
jgi:hypothetical protein